MRDYARVSPLFWIKGTGKKLRGDPTAQLVGLYLVTCSSANMIGLYYLPLALLCHETGLTLEGAREALARASEAGFAHYDEAAELVWVPNAATYQIGETIERGDNRRKGVQRELEPYAKHRFARAFFEKYRVPFHLDEPEGLASPLEGPSKPLRSQDQDQEQDQEQERESAPARVPDPKPDNPKAASRPTHALVGSTLTPAPEDIPLTREALARCSMAGTRAPTREDVAACLANARKKGHVRADWVEELVSWMIRQKSFDQRAANGGKAPEVQYVESPRVREERKQREAARKEYDRNAVPAPVDMLESIRSITASTTTAEPPDEKGDTGT